MNLATISANDMTSRPASSDERKWDAVLRRDRDFDGRFVFGVVTTGVYCRPSCPSRRPLRKNVSFFLSTQDARRAGLRACLRCKPDRQSSIPEAVEKARALLDVAEDERVTLDELAVSVGMSAFHLQREFKKHFGASPREYLAARRMRRFKENAGRSSSVTDAMLEAGFGSSRSFYEKSGALGVAPKSLQRGVAETLRWTVFETRFGLMVAALSARGVCALEFVDGHADAKRRLQKEFPKAELVPAGRELEATANALRKSVEGRAELTKLPLDLRGTAFQLAVWNHLRGIPSGQTRSYAEVARGIRRPSAVRAVARACATNRIAVVVPCHRVVRGSGETSGYKWGSDRKKKLLASEARRA